MGRVVDYVNVIRPHRDGAGSSQRGNALVEFIDGARAVSSVQLDVRQRRC